MILVWTGRGYIVPAATFLASLATEAATEAIFHDDRYYQNHAWPLSLALSVGGAVFYVVGKRLNGTSANSVEQPSLAPPREPPRHTFFWIRMEYWGLFLLAAAVSNAALR